MLLGNLAAKLICHECGAVRVRTRSGILCPNGHGKIIQLHVTKLRLYQLMQRARYQRWVATLPPATPAETPILPAMYWLFDGKLMVRCAVQCRTDAGDITNVRRIPRPRHQPLDKDVIAARCGDVAFYLRPAEAPEGFHVRG